MKGNNKGFTLVELLVVIVILFISSGSVIVGFGSYFASARSRLLENIAQEIDLTRAYAQTQGYPTYVKFYRNTEANQNMAEIYIIRNNIKEVLDSDTLGSGQYTIYYRPNISGSLFTSSITEENSLILGFKKANLSFKESDDKETNLSFTPEMKIDADTVTLHLVKDTGRVYIK